MILGGRAHTVAEAERLGKAGLPFVELSIIDPEAFYAGEKQALQNIRDVYGITYLAHGPEEGNAWEPELLRTQLLPKIRSLLDCLSALAINLFTIHFWLDRRFIDPAIINEKIPILKEMNAYAREKNIQLCIENLSEQAADFLPLFDEIPELGMTLDIGHGQLLTETNTTYGFCEQCFDKIRHIHLHDNLGGDSPEHDLHLLPGRGSIDFGSILGVLQDKGFDKTITLEVNPELILEGKAYIEKIWCGDAAPL